MKIPLELIVPWTIIVIDSDSFLLRCNDILFCTPLLRIPLYVIILPNAILYHLYAVVFSLQQRLPANVTTTAFAGTCQNLSQSVLYHSSTTLGGEYIFHV